MNSVCWMSLVVSLSKKDERERNIGVVETGFGLGYLLGPLIGSFMYSIGSYPMPFLFCGSFVFLCVFLIAKNLLSAKRIRENNC